MLLNVMVAVLVWWLVKTGMIFRLSQKSSMAVFNRIIFDSQYLECYHLYEHEKSKGELEYLFRHTDCFHCTDAGCEVCCPENAISHTKFGTVVVDHDKCVGCGYCVQGCYFDVIQLATYQDKKGKEYRLAQKCDLCTSRLENGYKPACVTACHTDCLWYTVIDKRYYVTLKLV